MVIIDRHFDQSRDLRTEDVDERLAVAISWRDYDESIQNEMLEILAEAAVESFPPGKEAHVREAAYHVGPMAQGPTIQMLFTAYESIHPIAEDVATWIAIGDFARLVFTRTRSMLRRRISEQGTAFDDDTYPGAYLSAEIVISQPLIQGLCFNHFISTYGNAKQRVSMDVSARSPYEGIVWAGRPDSSMTYTVRVWTGQSSYVYVVDGRGKPVEHFRIRGGEFTSLPLPDWYDE